MSLCLPTGYVENLEPKAFIDDQQAVEWQPDVLSFAASLAHAAGATTLVDLGCGHGRKLIPLANDFNVIGLDLPNVTTGLSKVDNVTWIGHDLASHPLPAKAVIAGSLVVCSDVIEHIVDVERLQDRFWQVLRGGAHCVVISTPDRSCYYPDDHLGPPRNPTHVREWTLIELTALMSSWGFTVEGASHTRSHSGAPDKSTSLLVIR